MALYKVLIKKSAEKELRAVPKTYLRKIVSKIQNLAQNPRPFGAEALWMEGKFLRLRQGDYRVVYEVDDEAGRVTIIKAAHRREVYG